MGINQTNDGSISSVQGKMGIGSVGAREITIQTNRKGFIEAVGEVLELLPAATFKIKLENEQEILCHLSGRMRMNRIMLLPGDKVKVEMTPYDLSKGRITYRF